MNTMIKMTSIVGLCLMGATAANAETTLYGKVKAFVGNADGETGVDGAGSRVGLKGKVPLNNGYTAIFQTEYDTSSLMDGGEGLKARNNTVGLITPFGLIRAGYNDTPAAMVDDANDIMNRTAAQMSPLGGGRARGIGYGIKKGPISFAVSSSPNAGLLDAAKYVSSGGETIALDKSLANTDGAVDGASAMLKYQKGNVTAALGQQIVTDYDAKSTHASLTYKVPAGHQIGLDYGKMLVDDTITSASLGGQNIDLTDPVMQQALSVQPLVVDKEESKMVLTGKYVMGRAFVQGQYGMHKDDKKSDADYNSKHVEVGYNLSKSTSAYISAYDEDEGGTEETGVGVVHNF